MTATTAELRPLLKRLKLDPMLDTLPERIALARRDGLDYADFLQIVLADEVSRRDHGRLELRLRQAGFEQLCRLEDFDWSAQVRLDRRLLDAACSLRFLDRREHVLLVGPVGVGKSFLAQALGYAAVRSGRSVRFVSADQYFRELAQARVDHSTEKAFRSFLAPDLLILDDLGLHRLSAQQSIDLYELIIGRHRSSSFVITSNRAVEEWLGLFDDPILGNSALDRLANASYQIVIEGESYRQRLSPHRALLERPQGGDRRDRQALISSRVPAAQGGPMPVATSGSKLLAIDSLRGRRRFRCCSECAVVARRMPSQCTAGDCLLCERKHSLSGPLQTVRGSASRWRPCLTLPSMEFCFWWETIREDATACPPCVFRQGPTRPVWGP